MVKSAKEKFNLMPTEGYLVVLQETQNEKTESGLYLPDSVSKEKPSKGVVVAVGDDTKTDSGVLRKSPAKANDKVVYKKWGGTEVEINKKEYVFVKFEDILAIEK